MLDREVTSGFVGKDLGRAMGGVVLVGAKEKSGTVVVPDEQRELAIGKEGQNARLANKLTGWRIDIKSESQMAEEEDTMAFSDEEVEELAGRCCALTKSGKRCPNASLPGTRYCGIASHQKQAEEEQAGEAESAQEPSSAEAENENSEVGEAEVAPTSEPGK